MAAHFVWRNEAFCELIISDLASSGPNNNFSNELKLLNYFMCTVDQMRLFGKNIHEICTIFIRKAPSITCCQWSYLRNLRSLNVHIPQSIESLPSTNKIKII